jgi:hypothetical protein
MYPLVNLFSQKMEQKITTSYKNSNKKQQKQQKTTKTNKFNQ